MKRLGLLVLGFVLGFVVDVAPVRAAVDPATLPPALREWIDWVRTDHEYVACPLRAGADGGDEGSYACTWPGELAIDASDSGAKFSQRWQVYTRGAVPLPGNLENWPQRVRANGVAVAVVAGTEVRGDGGPVLWLEPGTYEVEGAFDWDERPESLSVPESVALVRLTVDGAAIFPVQRESGALWLGRAESAAPRQADSLELQVFRLLQDTSVPAWLTTRVVLTVSGEGREEVLGKPLPAGWQPYVLSGDLPARLDPDGTLRVQVRPGTYTINLGARATAPLVEQGRPASAEPWPEEEIWSYEANSRLRVTTAIGANPIDPAQAGVPAEWTQHPAFLMAATDVLKIEENSRGMATQNQNRLTLSRTMWLDFDGGGFGTQDAITGSMSRDWRLDVAAPFTLERATEAGEGLLVTKGAKPGLTGVELRDRYVNVQAQTRLARSGGEVPITGWQHEFEGVTTTVNLPPGHRLFAAFGADSASGTWLDQWDLLDVFLVAVIGMLALWLLGPAGAAFVLGYLVLAYHEPGAPLTALLAAAALGLVAKVLPPASRLARFAGWLRNGALLVLVYFALFFIVAQTRLALHPQLERSGPDGYSTDVETSQPVVVFDAAMPMAPPPPVPQSAPMAVEERVQMEVAQEANQAPMEKSASGGVARYRAPKRLQRYANNTVVQAGSGQATWRWSAYQLSWSGPVLPAQDVRLVISPPWVTRLLRVAIVLLLALVLARLARDALARKPAPPNPIAAAALALALCLPGAALASTTPAADTLETLQERVLEAPDCAPSCGAIARAEVVAEGERIAIELEVHAVERVAVPLPGEEDLLGIQRVTIDGIAEPGVLRDDAGAAWVVVPRGVRRVVLELRAADADQIGLRFPLAPAWVAFEGTDWDASGIRDARLLTDTLQLTRVRSGESAPSSASVAQQFPPFVLVTRSIDLGLEWEVTTVVRRVSPDQAAFSVGIPLLAGERLLSAEYEVEDGKVVVPLQAGSYESVYVSRIDPADRVTLTAPDLKRHAETWIVRASEMWNLRYSGVPAVYPSGTEWEHEFHPLPGEALELVVARPESAGGSTLAIDDVTLTSDVGKRATEHALQLTIRSTQGGQHVVTLPKDAEVLNVALAGLAINVRPENGKLTLPVKPGTQQADIRWRETQAIGAVARTPDVGLGAKASNVRLHVNLPSDRWVLYTWGPRVGPAVLYWGELAVLLLIAYGLSRTKRTPLTMVHWLLLGLGFSSASWPAFLFVAGWLFAMEWRGRNPPQRAWLFDLVQLALPVLFIVAFFATFGALKTGLAGSPDMHVTGNQSYAHALRWFHDRTADALPTAGVLSVSIWFYKIAMLAFALWLVFAGTRWVRWAWGAYTTGGHWRRLRKPKPEPVPLDPIAEGHVDDAPTGAAKGDAPRDGGA